MRHARFARIAAARAVMVALMVATALAIVFGADSARADLSSDAELVASVWRAHDSQATRMPPLFLEHNRPRAIRLPPTAYNPATSACTTVAVLAGRSVDFVVRIDPLIMPKHRPIGGEAERSLAGTVVLVRCGEDRSALARLSVELRVARAAAEVIVAEGPNPAPPVASILPERATGPLAPLNNPGPRAPLEPPEERVARTEQQAVRNGARVVAHHVLTADADGTGRVRLHLDEGCHEIALVSGTAGQRPIDIDAEARDSETERLVARDRSDSADAHLDLCLGASSSIDLIFVGAGEGGPVLLSDSAYPLPPGIPARWGARARAGFAAAMRRRKLAPLTSPPLYEMLGASGATTMPFSVDPGACYLAATAVLHGEAHPLSMSVTLGAHASYDTNFGLHDGTVVAFCAGDDAEARIDVDARGASLSWVLAVWEVGMRDPNEQP